LNSVSVIHISFNDSTRKMYQFTKNKNIPQGMTFLLVKKLKIWLFYAPNLVVC